MSLGLAFWILMLVWAVFGVLGHLGIGGVYVAGGGTILFFVLFALLGWQIFGSPLRKS